MHRRLRSSLDERRPSTPPQKKSNQLFSPGRKDIAPIKITPQVTPKTTDPPYSPSTSTHSSGSRNRDRVLGLEHGSVPGSKLFLPPNVRDILPFAEGHPFAAWDHKGHERSVSRVDVSEWKEGARGKRTWGEYRGVYKVGWEREVLDLEARLHETMWEVAGGHTFSQAEPRAVLDLGTGLGLWPVSQALLWPEATFVGLDIVPCQIDLAALADAERKARASSQGTASGEALWERVGKRITWVQGDFLALPFDAGVFDMVHIRFVGLGLPESKWGDLLEEATRVLRSGGTLEIVEMTYTLTATSSLVNSFASLLLSDLVHPIPALPIKFYLPTVGLVSAPMFEQTWPVAPGALGQAVMVWVRSALDYKGTGIRRKVDGVLEALAEVEPEKWGKGSSGEAQGASVVAWVVTRG